MHPDLASVGHRAATARHVRARPACAAGRPREGAHPSAAGLASQVRLLVCTARCTMMQVPSVRLSRALPWPAQAFERACQTPAAVTATAPPATQAAAARGRHTHAHEPRPFAAGKKHSNRLQLRPAAIPSRRPSSSGQIHALGHDLPSLPLPLSGFVAVFALIRHTVCLITIAIDCSLIQAFRPSPPT
jgi:hypothetical protein